MAAASPATVIVALCLLLASSLDAAEMPIIKAVSISGLKRLHREVIERELPFAIGQPWQAGFAKETEKRLLATGLFSEVQVRAPDAAGVVRIYAHERWTIWPYPFVTRKDNGETTAGFGLTDFNAFGRAHVFHMRVFEHTGYNFGQRNQGRGYSVSYFWRRVYGSDWDLFLLFGQDRLRTQQGPSTATQWQVLMERIFGATPEHGWRLAAGWKTNDTFDASQIVRRRGPRLRLEYQDVFDHVDWLEGMRRQLDVESALTAFGSSVDAMRISAQSAWYRPIDDRGDTINYRIGAGAGLGNLTRFGIFDLGHRNGLRGYFPGEAPSQRYLLASLEARLRLPKAENVQFVCFIDAGWLKGEASGLYLGTGLGFRWILRWLTHGIARIDAAYGWRIRKWRVYLAAGQAF